MHRYYFVFEITALSKHISLLCFIIDIMISLLGAVTWALIRVVILGNKRTKSLCLFRYYFVLDFYFLELHLKRHLTSLSSVSVASCAFADIPFSSSASLHLLFRDHGWLACSLASA